MAKKTRARKPARKKVSVKRRRPVRRRSLRGFGSIVSFRTKSGRTVKFNRRNRGVHGLNAEPFTTRGGERMVWDDRKGWVEVPLNTTSFKTSDGTVWNWNASKRSWVAGGAGKSECLDSRGKLMKGWKYKRGGGCVKAEGKLVGRPWEKKAAASAPAAKVVKAPGKRLSKAERMKLPCVIKAGKLKGKLKSGWRVRYKAGGAFCAQTMAGSKKTAGYKYPCMVKTGKNKGKIKKGFRIRGGHCYAAGSTVALPNLRGLSRR